MALQFLAKPNLTIRASGACVARSAHQNSDVGALDAARFDTLAIWALPDRRRAAPCVGPSGGCRGVHCDEPTANDAVMLMLID